MNPGRRGKVHIFFLNDRGAVRAGDVAKHRVEEPARASSLGGPGIETFFTL
jgi:hypothetical protein